MKRAHASRFKNYQENLEREGREMIDEIVVKVVLTDLEEFKEKEEREEGKESTTTTRNALDRTTKFLLWRLSVSC
ncbi:MAG: hypothetical protein M3218_05100 [Thermoproteota archaeon]|nr:hypothetical protein [Thermoproteota archaeon]